MSELPLRVAVDARVNEATAGGVQQTLVGLAEGLSALDDGPEEYLFLAREDASAWLRPHLGGRARLLPAPRPAPPSWWRGLLRPVGRLAPVRRLVERGPLGRLVDVRVPPSDGTVERAGAGVVHFATQAGFSTGLPSLYCPHDLQHLHHPGFFTAAERRWRASYYSTLARQARAVVALSRFGKQDLVERLGLAPERVYVSGWAPITDAYGPVTDRDVAGLRERLDLPPAFAYYPAQTWRHKNHLRLLEALAILRDRDGLEVPLVSSGRRTDFFPELERRVSALGLGRQVRFLDFVSPADLHALYRAATILVFPSEFEGFGMPVVEAFRAALPVACAWTTSLPEVAGDAAVPFDPRRPDEIADAVARLWTDAPLRAELAARGRERVRGVSWDAVARRYRALYRLVGGRALTDEDRSALEAMR